MMKVCIIGTAPSHASAPYGDDSWTIFSLNDAWKVVPRADAWFDMHSPMVLRWSSRRPPGHLGWLKRFEGPVYLHEADPEIPTSVAYPLDAVIRDLGLPYLTSGPSYMLALAIHLKAEAIMVCGVDMTLDDYVSQRANFEWLIGLAMGRGIPVLLPSGCPLLTGPLYGRGPDEIRPDMLDEREGQMRRVVVELEAEYERRRAAVHELKGAVRSSQALLDLGLSAAPEISIHLADLARDLEAAELSRMATFTDLAQARGALQDVRYWQARMSAGQAPSDYARSVADASDGEDRS